MLYHMGGKVLTAEERQRFDQLVDGQKAIGDDRPNRVDTWKFRVQHIIIITKPRQPWLTLMTHESFGHKINLCLHHP